MTPQLKNKLIRIKRLLDRHHVVLIQIKDDAFKGKPAYYNTYHECVGCLCTLLGNGYGRFVPRNMRYVNHVLQHIIIPLEESKSNGGAIGFGGAFDSSKFIIEDNTNIGLLDDDHSAFFEKLIKKV